MSALRSPVGQALASAWYAWRNVSKLGLRWLVAAVGMGGWLALMVWASIAGGAKWLFPLLWAVLTSFIIWGLVTHNLLRQNDPHLARLVPGHPQVLRRALTLMAIALGLPLSVWLIVLASAQGKTLMTWPLLAMGWLISVAVLLAMRNFAVFFALGLVLVAVAQLTPKVSVITDIFGVPLGAAFALAVALALWVMRAQILMGGERHEKAQARFKAVAISAMGRMAEDGRKPEAIRWNGSARTGVRLFAIRFDKVIASAHAGINDRLLLGLGPVGHWTWALGSVVIGLVTLAGVELMAILVPRLFPDQAMSVGVAPVPVITSFAAAMIAMSLPAALHAGKRDQVLLRLLPGVPQGAALNQCLGRRWVLTQLALSAVTYLLCWAYGAVVEKGLWPEAMGGSLAAANVGMAMGIMAPLLAPALLRDWSKLKAPGSGTQLAVAGPMIVFMGLGALWTNVLQWSLWALAAVVLCALIPLLAWRWRVISRAPAALPVGRLA